jgi:hypothetical protein
MIPIRRMTAPRALLAAIALLPAIALAHVERAAPPAAHPFGEGFFPKSCAEARRDAQFLRELQKTDGDVSPDVPAIRACMQIRTGLVSAPK